MLRLFEPVTARSFPKNLRHGALQPVADLFEGVECDVLFTQFQAMKGRIRNAGFAGELLKSELPAFLTKERRELFCQCFAGHDGMVQPVVSLMWDILLARTFGAR